MMLLSAILHRLRRQPLYGTGAFDYSYIALERSDYNVTYNNVSSNFLASYKYNRLQIKGIERPDGRYGMQDLGAIGFGGVRLSSGKITECSRMARSRTVLQLLTRGV